MTRYFEDIIRDERKGLAIGLLKILLWMASGIYGCAVRMIHFGYDAGILPKEKLPKPVISIGNITVGGTGKTPLVIWLVKQLQAQGFKPAVLTRGYRSRNQGEGNDEIQMMSEICPDVPVIIGKGRYDMAMQFLFGHDIDVFVMDDGFQHRKLARDLDIVAVESLRGFGNGHLLPRGILREPLSGLKRADIVMLTKLDVNPGGEPVILQELKKRGISKPLVRSCQKVSGMMHLKDRTIKDASWLKGQDVVILSSIADPKSFEETVKQQGARIVERLAYPDHYDYQVADIRRVVDVCRSKSRNTIVTTHKDAVKLANLSKEIPQGLDIWVLNMELNVRDDENILGQRIRHLFKS